MLFLAAAIRLFSQAANASFFTVTDFASSVSKNAGDY